MSNVLGQVVAAVVTLPVLAVTRYLIPWLMQKNKNEKIAGAKVIVDIAVAAAEQKAKAGIINAIDRKDNALSFIENNNLAVDQDTINTMIESAVIKLAADKLLKK